MRSNNFLFSLLICIIHTISYQNTYATNNLNEYKVSYDKNYTCSALTDFEVGNKFGNIQITEWDNDQISIHIDIIAKDKDKDDAMEMAKQISFDEINQGNKISIKTNFANNNKSAFQYLKSFFKEISYSQNNISIYYKIYIPHQLHSIQLNNTFGNIQFGKFDFPTTCNLSYGSITGNEISKFCNLNLSFATATIAQLQNADCTLSYSKLFNTESNKINILKSNFSTISIDNIDILNITKDNYGKIEIEHVDIVYATCTFSNVKIDKLNQSATIKYSFGDLRIKEFTEQTSSIKLDGKLGACNIGIQAQSSFKIHASSKMGDVKMNNVTLTKSSITTADANIKIITGQKNCNDSNCTQIDINCEQCNISLYNYEK